MKKFFVRHCYSLFAAILITGMSISFHACQKTSVKSQAHHDHQAYHVIHNMPAPVHIAPDQIHTLKNIDEKRKAFIANFLPLIQSANTGILNQRQMLDEIRDYVDSKGGLNTQYLTSLNTLLNYYRLSAVDTAHVSDQKFIAKNIDDLELMVDIIPVKLVMAQAIIESGWGTSRFSGEINNYFGVHCYSRGCGVKPGSGSDANFEVKRYPGKLDAIKDYLHILNTGHAYGKLRLSRAEARSKGQEPDPFVLAESLGSYSEKGNTYIDLIKNIMQNYIPENTAALLQGN